MSSKTVGVIGSGAFGTAVANIIAKNYPVLLYTRRAEIVDQIKDTGIHKGQKMDHHVSLTTSVEEICNTCSTIFPIVASKGFRNMMQTFSPHLRPDHILIHGTKGFFVDLEEGDKLSDGDYKLSKEQIRRMSELIVEDSMVRRIGVMSGPNLASEIAEGKPAATVIASQFDEVIETGKDVLRNETFRVYGSHDVIGVEMAGALKNILAIAAGIVDGLNLGVNAKSFLITRGLGEMLRIGKIMGSDAHAFMGLAGIGDLVATCSSSRSRNYTVGNRLAKGDTLEQITETMEEVAEGVRTTKIARTLIKHYNLHLPIIETLDKILYEKQSIPDSMTYLMAHHFEDDADFVLP